MSNVKKAFSIFLCVIAAIALLAGAADVAKQPVKVELFYAGGWHDHTARTRSVSDPIVINHAALNEQTGLAPSDASLALDNRDNEMNPENRKGSLFGLVGEGTKIRITVVPDIRFTGRISSMMPRRAVKGNQRVLVKAQGTLRRLGQGTPPIESALYRTILHEAKTTPLLAYWPLEGGGNQSNRFASALPGGLPFSVPDVGLTLADETSLPGSLPLPTRGIDMPPVSGRVHLQPSVGTSWTYDLWVKTDPLNSGATHLVMASGEIWALTSNAASDMQVYHFTAAGVETFVMGTGVGNGMTTDAWYNIRLTATQDGADSDLALYLNGVLMVSGTKSGSAIGIPVDVKISDPLTLVSSADWEHFGHATVWDGIPSGSFDAAGRGYPSEKAGDRFNRLGLELDIATTIVGSAADTQPMGAQYPDTTLKLLEEIARTDAGFIYDTRADEGLTLRTGRSLQNQTA